MIVQVTTVDGHCTVSLFTIEPGVGCRIRKRMAVANLAMRMELRLRVFLGTVETNLGMYT